MFKHRKYHVRNSCGTRVHVFDATENIESMEYNDFTFLLVENIEVKSSCEHFTFCFSM